jgi:tRNA threonylcarbamoyladenosine modification (KEOPS) complex  Pcc1 subunit
MKHNNLDYLIKMYVYPLLEEECKRLKIPKNFILGIYGCYCKDFVVGYVEEIKESDNLIGVKIKIGDCNESLRSILKVFFHEMYHVKELYNGKKLFLSELRADLYAELRLLQLALNRRKYIKQKIQPLLFSC